MKKQTLKITLTDSLPGARGGYPWHAIAAAARDNPGAWVKVPKAAPYTKRRQVRNGLLSAFRPIGAFDAAIREGRLYIRFLGEPVDAGWWYQPDADFDTIERRTMRPRA